MAVYRRKPAEVDATQFLGGYCAGGAIDILSWMESHGAKIRGSHLDESTGKLDVTFEDGILFTIWPGYYVIKDWTGADFFTSHPVDFVTNYESIANIEATDNHAHAE